MRMKISPFFHCSALVVAGSIASGGCGTYQVYSDPWRISAAVSSRTTLSALAAGEAGSIPPVPVPPNTSAMPASTQAQDAEVPSTRFPIPRPTSVKRSELRTIGAVILGV